MADSPHGNNKGLTLLETLASLALIAVLLSIMLPALWTARVASRREQCQRNLQQFHLAWEGCVHDGNGQFPYVPMRGAWHYGGVRFSADGDQAFPDFDRPLTRYLPLFRTSRPEDLICCCPADRGITDEPRGRGTGERTAFRSFGTSYRANALLLDAQRSVAEPQPRGMRREEITTAPSRLVLMGDPVWYEAAEETGLDANWHEGENRGNMLFLDGSVRMAEIRPRRIAGPIVFTPTMPGITVYDPPQLQERPSSAP